MYHLPPYLHLPPQPDPDSSTREVTFCLPNCDYSLRRGPGGPPMAAEPGMGLAVIRDKGEMRSWSRSRRAAGETIALVPTMGYLHRGHLSLVEEAKRRAKVTVVSIYVNPGQFAPTEDLATYPSDLQGDLRNLAEVGVDAVFCPANLYDYGDDGGGGGGMRGGQMGAWAANCGASGVSKEGKLVSCVEDGGREGAGHETWIRVERLEKGLCGQSRPVFFRGVATVVTKLFNIVEPDIAMFGKKDYQQWRVIRRMVKTRNMLSMPQYTRNR